MAGSFSNFLENELLDHVFVASYTKPTNYFVALSTGTIVDSDTGGGLTNELTGGAYVRKEIATFDVASGGATKNSQAITFAQATAAWGTITSFAICDAITKGNHLCHGTLTTSKDVSSGDTARFATDELDITLA